VGAWARVASKKIWDPLFISTVIFIVLHSTVDILMILVFFVLILMLYFSDVSCSASIITCNPLTVCDTMA